MPGPTVWIAEEVDYDSDPVETFGDPDMWLLGTFMAHVEDGDAAQADGLTLDEALKWGRARAKRVLIRLGEGGYWSAGADPVPEFESWDSDLHPPIVRRRPEAERWKDRAPDDPPIQWTVEVSLAPVWEQQGRMSSELAMLESELSEAAATTRPDSLSREEIDGFLAVLEKSRAEGAPFVYAPMPRWIMTFTYAAATRELAAGAVKRRVSSAIADGWDVFAHAVPAD